MILKNWTKIASIKFIIFAIAFAAAATGMTAATDENCPTMNVYPLTSVMNIADETCPTKSIYPLTSVMNIEVNTASLKTEVTAEDNTESVDETSESNSDFVYLPELALSKELQHYTYKKCAEQEVDYTLILALMWRESRFQATAVGYNSNGTSDNGIMQINDVNRGWLAKELGINNLLDPYQNIMAGTEILGRLAGKHGMHNALLAYQYGEGGMRRKLAQGITTNKQIEYLYEKKAEFDAMIADASATL